MGTILSPETSCYVYKWARILQNVPYGCYNQNLANYKVSLESKYYTLRALSENLKQLSLILTNIWRLETTFITWFGT